MLLRAGRLTEAIGCADHAAAEDALRAARAAKADAAANERFEAGISVDSYSLMIK